MSENIPDPVDIHIDGMAEIITLFTGISSEGPTKGMKLIIAHLQGETVNGCPFDVSVALTHERAANLAHMISVAIANAFDPENN